MTGEVVDGRSTGVVRCGRRLPLQLGKPLKRPNRTYKNRGSRLLDLPRRPRNGLRLRQKLHGLKR